MNTTLHKDVALRLGRGCLFLIPFLLAFSVSALADTGAPYIKAAANTANNLADITVKGTVVDSKGEPVPGATIKVKNSTKSAAANANGEFTITLASGEDVLVISFIGFKTQEVSVKGKNNIHVVLEDGNKALNEVVVIGYGTTKKRDLTGSVVSVKSEDITARPGPNPIESLQGRVPGLDITRTSGQAGAGVNIQLRGTRSFKADGTPLFIINGLPGDYATINANDIESIDVLKDASATAVYGSAGANGVIIITTKSGKSGKMNIDFNSYYGFNGWSVLPKMLTGEDYLRAKRDAYSYVLDKANSKWVKSYTVGTVTTSAQWQSPADDPTIFGAQRYALYQQGQFVDWPGVLLRKNPNTQNYSLAASGGTEATKAYVSFNLQDENSQYRGDDYKLYSTNIRLDHKIKNWVSIGANLQASYVVRNKAQDKLENAITTDPLIQPYNPDGSLNTVLGNNVYNLLLDYQPGVYENLDNNTKVFFNPYVEVRPIKGLSILSRAGVHMDYSNSYRFDGIGSVSYTYANANIAKAKVNQDRYEGLQWENILTYNLKVRKDHELTFTGVTSYYYNQNNKTEMNQSNITSNNFEWYKFTGDVNTTAITSYTMSKSFGLIGRLNYSYKGKYLFSASVRHDGASQLYETNRWDTFPAFSAAWRISDEKFMAGTKSWLDDLKLRGSWGITGTAKIDPYSSVSNVEAVNSSVGGTTTPIYRNSLFLTNPDLAWEKSTSTNLGLDASVFNGRINLTADYYNTNTNGVIFAVALPSIYGTYTPGTNYQTNINIAQTNNKGIEVALSTRNVVTKDFEWSSSISYSRNWEKVLKITDNTDNVANTGTSYTLMLGQPVNSFRNYKVNGVWQIGEEADAAAFGKYPGDLKIDVPGMTKLATGVYTKQAANGTTTYYYANLAAAQQFNPALTAANSLYSYSANDNQFVGHNSPDWSLGFQNHFKYKNFDLTVYSYMRWGQTISYNLMGWYQPGAFAINASPSRTFPADFNYWTPTNPSNDFPVMDVTTSTSTLGFSGLNFVDGSFFKVKNITLGYTLPGNIGKKIGLQRFRIYGTVTNPVVLAKSHFLKDYDPEMNGGLAYPLTKQLVFGLDITL
ncbi:TonB-dependent receptor [Mucilaginibacter sp. HMF5004]|uniref:SusC/RagA family TonB-linked outer membrane protein n=1 Tax=Mucilaginibacter rivuli TaxID=2857527 RepID=UPI001C5F9D28|nr:TonB-dependent receptor [Mucilaginibacter rivuli]MBW4889948.1 TonB-dependent receptor [Mucilaginibacter rivuli]